MTLDYLHQQLRIHLAARNHENAYVRNGIRVAVRFEVARLRALNLA